MVYFKLKCLFRGQRKWWWRTCGQLSASRPCIHGRQSQGIQSVGAVGGGNLRTEPGLLTLPTGLSAQLLPERRRETRYCGRGHTWKCITTTLLRTRYICTAILRRSAKTKIVLNMLFTLIFLLFIQCTILNTILLNMIVKLRN